VNLLRTWIAGALIVALPLSATASFAASLSCPHRGLGTTAAAQAAHDHAAMAAMQHAGANASMHHGGADAPAHHACDCVHHCAGAHHALAAPSLTFDGLTGAPAAPSLYRSFHFGSSEPPLLRPPISTAAA